MSLQDRLEEYSKSSTLEGRQEAFKSALQEMGGDASIHVREAAFLQALQKDDLVAAQFVQSLDRPGDQIDLHKFDEAAFQIACENGNAKAMLWLLNLEDRGYGDIDIHASQDQAFILSCGAPKPDATKALLNLEASRGRIDIHAQNDQAYRNARSQGNSEIALHLVSLEATRGPIRPTSEHDKLFLDLDRQRVKEAGHQKDVTIADRLKGNLHRAYHIKAKSPHIASYS